MSARREAALVSARREAALMSMCGEVRKSAIGAVRVPEIDTARQSRTMPIPKKGWSPGAGIAGAPSNLIQQEV